STTWTWTRDHVYREGLLLATVSPSGREQFHVDHLGTARLVTDGSGVQRGVHAYYPFGDELDLTAKENPWERLKFTGHERDEPSGVAPVDYMHARYFAPVQGRFLSPDPVLGNPRRPQSWNRYSYVLNNPINNTDPSGRCTNSIVCLNYQKVEDDLPVTTAPRQQAGTWEAVVNDMTTGTAQEYAAIDNRAASDNAKYSSVAAKAIHADYNEFLLAVPLAAAPPGAAASTSLGASGSRVFWSG